MSLSKSSLSLATFVTAISLVAVVDANAQEIDEIEVIENGDEVGFGGGGVGTPEEYVVRPGDTLWDLSDRFLQNPWYWPKLWSYNPQLDNPNWIRPGTRIKFYPGDTGPIVIEDAPIDDLEDDDFADVPVFQGGDAVSRFAYVGDTSARRRVAFIPDEEIEQAAKIGSSPNEKTMLSLYDQVYLEEAKKLKVGERLQVFRVGDRVYHPVTGSALGRRVEVLGLLTVDQTGDGEDVATINAAWGEIGRGDFVSDAINTDVRSIQRQANEKEVKGYIVSSARDPLAFAGRANLVFIDRGKNDGVEVGNAFTVVRAEDPFTGKSRGLEDIDIGSVLITDVRSTTSTGVVVKAERELVAGDRLEMRTK